MSVGAGTFEESPQELLFTTECQVSDHISDEVYDTLLLLVQGKFDVSVKKRTRVQKNALVRFWRRQEQFHLGKESTPTLYFSGKKVVKKSSTSAVIANTFDQAKSGGGKKLRDRAASNYSELREKNYYKLRTTNLNTAFTTRGLRTRRLLNPLQQSMCSLSTR